VSAAAPSRSEVGPRSSTGRLGVVIVNYASHDLLEQHLRLGEHLVVVVDSFSTTAEQEALREQAGRRGFDLLLRDDNAGFGAAANQGAAHAIAAGCDVVLLLNPDAHAEPEVLAALADHVRADPHCAVTPRIDRPDGRVWFRGGELDLRTGRTHGADAPVQPWLTAACLAVHRDLWLQVGGFDPGYFMYWEDVDLSHRMRAAGARLIVRQDLVAVHEVGGTQSGGRAKSAMYYDRNCRGRLRFAATHLPPRTVLRWVLGAPAYARAVVLRGGRRQLTRPDRTVLPAVRGTVGGLALALPAIARGVRRGR
jgi:N-acetylglucosaminyl-diphospho-decaprenol L-rhamnosyltransferase